MPDSFELSYDFAEKYVRFAKPECVQVYLYLRYKFSKDGQIPDVAQLAKELGSTKDQIEFVLDYWCGREELVRDGESFRFPDQPSGISQPKPVKKKPVKLLGRQRPSYTMEEIDGAAAANKPVADLISQAEGILCKQLTPSDVELLYSFHDWLGLPVEVIIMLLSYAAKRGKTQKRYLETVAIDWADKGIDTYEAAEAYVSELEEYDSLEHQIRSILGIYDRALTQTEKKYVTLWCRDLCVPSELVQVAYDKTVEYTGKLSWAYMNKLLTTWQGEGITSAAQVKERDDQYKQNAPQRQDNGRGKTQKSKFNNYEDTNSKNYANLEEKLLDMMLDDQ